MSNEITTSPAQDRASLVIGVEASDNAIKYTSVVREVAGNLVRVRHVNPGTNNASLGVVVSGKDITVNLATNGSAAATSTADAVIDAIEASAPASALVTVDHVGDSNGTGVVATAAYTALAGGVESKVSSVHTTTVVTDPESDEAVQIPPEADATGRDALNVHELPTPNEALGTP